MSEVTQKKQSLRMVTGRDPVCGRQIELEQSSHLLVYRGGTYHFCSAHCQERFTDIPALYTGPQRLADIRPIPKQRKLRVLNSAPMNLARACQRLQEMIGVSAVTCAKDCLIVGYDLRLTILAQIEAVAVTEGVHFKEGLHGLRRRLWKSTEANELENAAHPATGACCNRPPVRLR